eukprot:5541965-Prymnesium_polylepis.1
MDVSIDCQAASGSPSMRLCRPDVVCCSAMCSVKEKPSVVISRSDMNGMISRNTCRAPARGANHKETVHYSYVSTTAAICVISHMITCTIMLMSAPSARKPRR